MSNENPGELFYQDAATTESNDTYLNQEQYDVTQETEDLGTAVSHETLAETLGEGGFDSVTPEILTIHNMPPNLGSKQQELLQQNPDLEFIPV